MSTLVGTAGADALTAGIDGDLVQGLGGNDTLYGGDGPDRIEGGDGNDVIEAYGSSDSAHPIAAGADTVLGGAGDDAIEADLFDAVVDGGDGNDVISIARTMYVDDAPQRLGVVTGGAGDDTFSIGYFNASDRLVVEGGAGTNTLHLQDWRLPEIWLNQDHDGPGLVAHDIQVLDLDQTWATIHGGDAAEVYKLNYHDDSVDAGGGDDLIIGDRDGLYLSGADTLLGSAGNDTVEGMGGQDYLRGGTGDDSISGGAAFDDTHGNEGNDTVSGGDGADWVVGGKDQDVLYGDAGDDIVYGNLGADSQDGGAGADTVRGGQADDALKGGDGDDWLSGDLGSDTLTGGAGADTFHTFATAGLDRVLDFNAAEGDRVQVDAGSTSALSQQGSNTIIDFGGGNQMVLVGVQLSTLPTGWIFTL